MKVIVIILHGIFLHRSHSWFEEPFSRSSSHVQCAKYYAYLPFVSEDRFFERWMKQTYKLDDYIVLSVPILLLYISLHTYKDIYVSLYVIINIRNNKSCNSAEDQPLGSCSPGEEFSCGKNETRGSVGTTANGKQPRISLFFLGQLCIDYKCKITWHFLALSSAL